MKRGGVCVGLVLAVAAISGCLPETLITWSPDGRYALVRGGGGLAVCDGDGHLSPALAEEVPAVAWLPDSRRFIAASGTYAATWDELLPHLSDERRQTAQAEAEAFRGEILAYKGDWGAFRFRAESADILAALMCLRDQHGAELGPVVGDKWSGLKDLRHGIYALRLFEVADGKADKGKVLLESLEPPAEIRVAPTGKAFAYAAPPYPALGAEAAFSLLVVSLAAPDAPQRVADRVSIFFDWTPDGRSVVFAFTNEADPAASNRRAHLSSNESGLVYRRRRMPEAWRSSNLRAGRIVQRTVVDAEGGLVEKGTQDLVAEVAFFDSMPVRSLRDGRILFAAKEVRLPAASGAISKTLSLFCRGADGTLATLPVLAPEGRPTPEYRLDLLQLSPDETRATLPTDAGPVAVLDLATGKVTDAWTEETGSRLPAIPVWRSDQELCLVVPKGSKAGSADREAIVLWSPQGTRCLSKDWPAPAASLNPK